MMCSTFIYPTPAYEEGGLADDLPSPPTRSNVSLEKCEAIHTPKDAFVLLHRIRPYLITIVHLPSYFYFPQPPMHKDPVQTHLSKLKLIKNKYMLSPSSVKCIPFVEK